MTRKSVDQASHPRCGLWSTLSIGMMGLMAVGTNIVSAASTHQLYDFHDSNRKLEIDNQSEETIVVDWLDPTTGKTIEFGTIAPGNQVNLNTFINHSFIFHYSGSGENQNSTCYKEQSCPSSAIMTVDESQDQVLKVKEGLELEHLDATTKAPSSESQLHASKIVDRCESIARKRLERGVMEPERVFEAMLTCVQASTAEALMELAEKLAEESKLRQQISTLMENYTCADNDLPTSPAKEYRDWMHHGVERKVHVLHERKASKIHMIEDFISREECEAIERAAAPTLHPGTVADGSGGSRLSDHRKAMQAGVKIPWEREAEGDHIAAVVRRLYDYANSVTGYNMGVEGQEDLMSIQYFGRGDDDTAPDRYMPHCDGDCTGLPHKTGGRVATMVMYCDAPIRGGGTNFGHAGVYVKPTVGAAAFFSYLDNETRVHETGFTTHSGCPVVEGVKRIAVQWMRIGVDEENHWDSFNTLNVKKSEAEDC